MAALLWIISGILLYSLAHPMVSADVDKQDRTTSEEYVEYQKTLSESETLGEIPNTDSLVNSDNHDTVKERNSDSTNPESGNSDNVVKESNYEKSERTFSPQDNENSAIKESTQSKDDSLEDNEEDIVQDQSKIVQDQNEISNDKTGEEIKELDAHADTSNESYHEYLSFGNILKSIVDPVLESSSEVLADIPTLDSNASSLNFTQVLENATLDKSVGEEDELTNKTDKKVRFQCSGRNYTDENVTDFTVKIVNNTGLLNALNFDKNESVSDCVLVLFFAPWCPFCAKMAPNYNALARAFPQLEVLAVDAAQFSNLNARFGTVLVPNILLFHQSRALVRFNQTDKSFDNLASFVRNITGLEPNSSVNVTEKDYEGPLSSIPTEETDYLLWVAWLFVLIFTGIVFVQSTYGQQCITKVRILWQEHQHID
ncbi:thioredoxin domain-containing protein 15-like [Argopecten irradians]|uniref:thioredoxin domain-containing protein 15-like n=1 Tax=Argopecten irradians TaxID=31199 RepID=UPI00371F0175